MFEDRRVLVLGVLDRLLQGLEGLLELAPLEQDPAEAVEVRRVVRLGGDRLADHPLRLLQVLALVGVEVAQIVIHAGVVRVLLEQDFQLGLALGEVALVGVDDREVRSGDPGHLVVVGELLQHRLVLGDRIVRLAGLVQETGQREVVLDVGRVELQRLLEDLDRLVAPPRLAEDRAQDLERVAVVGFELEGVLDRGDGLIGLAGPGADLAQEDHRPGATLIGELADQLLDRLLRLVKAAEVELGRDQLAVEDRQRGRRRGLLDRPLEQPGHLVLLAGRSGQADQDEPGVSGQRRPRGGELLEAGVEHLVGERPVGRDLLQLRLEDLDVPDLGGHDLHQAEDLLGLLLLEEGREDGGEPLEVRLLGDEILAQLVGPGVQPRLAVSLDQQVLELDVLGVVLRRLLQLGQDLLVPLQLGEQTDEEVIRLAARRLPLEEPLDERQGLGLLAGVLIRLAEQQENLGVLGVVDEPMLEGKDRGVDLARGQEDRAEFEVGLRFVVAEDAPTFGRGELLARLAVEALDHLEEGVGGLVELLGRGVVAAEFKLDQQGRARVGVELLVLGGRPERPLGRAGVILAAAIVIDEEGQGVDVPRLALQHLVAEGDGLIRTIEGEAEPGHPADRAHRFGVGLERGLERFQRVGPAALVFERAPRRVQAEGFELLEVGGRPGRLRDEGAGWVLARQAEIGRFELLLGNRLGRLGLGPGIVRLRGLGPGRGLLLGADALGEAEPGERNPRDRQQPTGHHPNSLDHGQGASSDSKAGENVPTDHGTRPARACQGRLGRLSAPAFERERRRPPGGGTAS